MLQIDEILKEMVEMGASDIFFKVDVPPSLRVDGRMKVMSHPPIPSDKMTDIANEMMTQKMQEKFEKENEMDLAIAVDGLGRFRVNIFRQRANVGLVMRHVPFPDFEFEELGLPPAVKFLSERRRGLVLVTGTTGSGKSTTLAAMLNHINEHRHCHIMTVEDPIEFMYADQNSMINQREIGMDTESFGSALRHVLRQSPDVILIGEMRDLETIQTAVAAAETGHLVMSTLHTTDAVTTVERVINYFPSHIQHQIRMEISLTLQGIISQRLLKRAGNKGRIPATEIMIVTSLIKKLLYEGKTLELREYITDGGHVGMMTFDQCLLNLYNNKKIDMETALENASSPDEFRLAADGISSGVKTKDFTNFG